MAPNKSGFGSWEVGQQILYQPPVSITSRLPSASSITSVGWKSGLSEARKSLSLVLNVAPSGSSTWRVTLCKLKQHTKRLSWYSPPNTRDSYRITLHGA